MAETIFQTDYDGDLLQAHQTNLQYTNQLETYRSDLTQLQHELAEKEKVKR